MKTIPLTQGYFAKVDDEDYEELARYRWFVSRDKDRKVEYLRVCRNQSLGYGKRTTKVMSRILMKATKGMFVDHINGDPLDNQKSNLRVCSVGENCQNRRTNYNSESGYRGVVRNWYGESKNLWVAQIYLNKKKKQIGSFVTKEEAAVAYNNYAIKLYGKFAKLNVIKNTQND